MSRETGDLVMMQVESNVPIEQMLPSILESLELPLHFNEEPIQYGLALWSEGKELDKQQSLQEGRVQAGETLTIFLKSPWAGDLFT